MAAKVYDMTCSRMGIIMLALVVFPLAICGIMFGILIAAGDDLPDWAIGTFIAITIGLALWWTIGFLKKWGNIPCTVELDEKRITIRLKQKSIFYPGTVFSSSWADLRAASSGYEPQRQQHFYKVQFSSPSITIYLNSTEVVSNAYEETEFGSLFLAYVALQNSDFEQKGKQPIDTKNFYQSGWAKAITFLMWPVLTGSLIASFAFPETVESIKVWQFSIYSGIWLAAYYSNNRKKRE